MIIGLPILLSLLIVRFIIDLTVKLYQLKVLVDSKQSKREIRLEEGTNEENWGHIRERQTALVARDRRPRDQSGRNERSPDEIHLDDLPSFSIPHEGRRPEGSTEDHQSNDTVSHTILAKRTFPEEKGPW